jgi:hypothetical protein
LSNVSAGLDGFHNEASVVALKKQEVLMDREAITKAPLENTRSGDMIPVIFTGMSETLKALEKASELAKPLSADIAVIVVQVVPFPLSLDMPPISLETVLNGFEERTRQFPEKIRVFSYLCRDEMEGLKRALKSGCPVVIDTTKSLLPTREEACQ